MKSIIVALLCFFSFTATVAAQEPQTSTDPISAMNAKYVNGVAPGYWATAGSGLTLNISAGTANCLSAMVTYAGSTLTMANNTTNYVYLNTAASCVPASNTTGFNSVTIPLATVVTSGGVITSITDSRTMQVAQASSCSGPGVICANDSLYGMKWDAQQISTASFTSGSPNVSSSVAVFSASDVGKVAFGFTSCNTDSASQGVNIARTTIVTFTDSTHVVVGANAGATQASTACFIWGTPDDTALAAVEAAALASPTCPRIQMPAKSTILEAGGHFIQNVPTCAKSPAGVGQALTGWGEVISGQGKGVTTLFLSPSFTTGTSGCTGGTGNTACFFGQQGQLLRGFQINGGGNLTANFGSALNAVEIGSYSLVQDVGFFNYGVGGNNTKFKFNALGEIGFEDSIIDQFAQVLTAASGEYRIVHSSIQDFCGSGITVNTGATWDSYGSFYAAGSCATTSMTLLNNAGGTVNSYGDLFFTDLSVTRNFGIQNTVGTAVSSLYGTRIVFTNGAGGVALFNNASGAVFNTMNGSYGVGGGDLAIFQVSGAITNDWGGNKITAGTVNSAGIFHGALSITGVAVAGSFAASGGWGNTAAFSAVTGSTRKAQFTLTNTGTGQAASPTITYTYPVAFWSATNLVCSAVQVGGTQALTATSNFTPGTPSVTAVTFTYNGTPTVNLTEVVQVSCDAP